MDRPSLVITSIAGAVSLSEVSSEEPEEEPPPPEPCCTVRVNSFWALPAALTAVTVKVLLPAASGVPESRPVSDRVSQAGRPVAEKVMGAVPSAASCTLYAVPTVAAGSGVSVVMAGAVGVGSVPLRMEFRVV